MSTKQEDVQIERKSRLTDPRLSSKQTKKFRVEEVGGKICLTDLGNRPRNRKMEVTCRLEGKNKTLHLLKSNCFHNYLHNLHSLTSEKWRAAHKTLAFLWVLKLLEKAVNTLG